MKLMSDTPYGYKVDISDPKILLLYERFKKWKRIPLWCPLSDAERFEFEGYILKKKSVEVKGDGNE